MMIPILMVIRNRSKSLLVLLEGILQKLQQRFCVNGAGDDPGVKLRPVVSVVQLAEVEQELESIVADFEVVGIASFEIRSFLGIFMFVIHCRFNNTFGCQSCACP